MTSTQVISLNRQINTLTSQINEQKVREDYSFQYDGILSDLYNGQDLAGPYNTPKRKVEKLEEYKAQKQEGIMRSDYRNFPVYSEKDVDDLKHKQDDDPNRKINSRKLFEANSWLALPMPRQFNYTGAIMRMRNGQGLLHSLLRHSTEWAQVIPEFQARLERLSPSTRKDLDKIGNAKSEKEAKALLDAYNIDSVDLEELSDLQMQIYRYLRENITYLRYLGEGINEHGRLQVFFEVIDINGQTQVMVVCPSEQLYCPDENLNDLRPIRTITTIFFISLKDCQKRKIGKMF